MLFKMRPKPCCDYAAAARVAVATTNAYSFDRYASWAACVRLLQQLGFNEQEMEAVLRSKWMRWAADNSTKPGRVTSADLGRWLNGEAKRLGVLGLRQQVAQLTWSVTNAGLSRRG